MSNSSLIRFSIKDLDNKIKAIKFLRMCTGYGLKDAKDLIYAGYHFINCMHDATFYVHVPFISPALECSVFGEMSEMRGYVEFIEHHDNEVLPRGTMGSPMTEQAFNPYDKIASNENIIDLSAAIRRARIDVANACKALENANSNLYELEARMHGFGLKVIE